MTSFLSGTPGIYAVVALYWRPRLTRRGGGTQGPHFTLGEVLRHDDPREGAQEPQGRMSKT